MDYLNYGKQVKEQPQKPQPQGFVDIKQQQKPQPQGFGQQNVQLTINDFCFGDLNQQTTQPEIAAPVNPSETISLFPTPLSIYQCPFDFTKELNWIKKQKSRNNSHQEESIKDGNLIHEEKLYNKQSENTFLLDDPIMKNVRKFIEEQLKKYNKEIIGSSNELVITQSWFNKNSRGMQHHEHTHPNSIISGVWYPQIDESLPPIKFKSREQPTITGTIENYNHFNSATFMLPLRNGELILFPSNLSHSVPINQSDKERISLSFNTWAKGSLGNIEHLTYLPLDRCV